MNVTGSSSLVILGTLAAVSYFISKLKRGRAPFVPTQPAPAAPAPAAAYNQATGLALLPDINYQSLPQPFRGMTQDFCSFPQPQHATHLNPSFAPPHLPAGFPPVGTSTGSAWLWTASRLPRKCSPAPLLQRGHGHGGRDAQPRPERSQSRPGPGRQRHHEVEGEETMAVGEEERRYSIYLILAGIATKGVG